ncbi:chalcone isomerase family protein [Thalassotalea mangrovi]|uniref:Chalcone isomerase domain-containing protein n=1 Tax=Thalassotalea mangrovi TaxID=2572245 RepID=A0A4U1B8W8_9GAMM|nr:chalcone isomerase family protein [Thalassotalea mangrovi]TKB47140.1 hypothetical protein E8M12_02450 [Thalassotalea mangrovi]
MIPSIPSSLLTMAMFLGLSVTPAMAFADALNTTQPSNITHSPDPNLGQQVAISSSDGGGTANISDWQQVGQAELKVLFWDVYLAKLFTPDGEFDTGSEGIEHPLRLHLTYFLDIEGEKLAEETEKQWHKMKFEHPRNSSFIAQLGDVFPDIQEQDSLTIETSSSGDAKLFHNQQLIHEFEPSIQIDQFLAIWLSEKSSRPKLMKQLTGQNQ